jgi:thiol-disulfide isomerase/thioredoxin
MKILITGLCVVVAFVFLYDWIQIVSTAEQDPTPSAGVAPANLSEELPEVIPPNITMALQELSRSVVAPEPYQEFVNPSAYIHTNGAPITIGEHIGKKIILLSFMTYSCINCQRTFPTLARLDEEYRDDGLVVIGIHTPEFAFEHDQNRVQDELAKYGITFPVVLDNTYETWNAYKNRFWPRRYIIDISGNIVYDHIGEGDYEGTERVIKALLPTLPTV